MDGRTAAAVAVAAAAMRSGVAQAMRVRGPTPDRSTSMHDAGLVRTGRRGRTKEGRRSWATEQSGVCGCIRRKRQWAQGSRPVGGGKRAAGGGHFESACIVDMQADRRTEEGASGFGQACRLDESTGKAAMLVDRCGDGEHTDGPNRNRKDK